DAVELYLFDKKLRLLVMDALERIEIGLRVDIVYLLGQRNTFAHLDATALHPTFAGKVDKRSGKTTFDIWQDKYKGLLDRSKEDFVKHYREKHGPHLPL
ncbi:Abi family protein, partial [Pseudomonas sp. FSL R10-0071]